mgnify:CR=1 FL=1
MRLSCEARGAGFDLREQVRPCVKNVAPGFIDRPSKPRMNARPMQSADRKKLHRVKVGFIHGSVAGAAADHVHPGKDGKVG